MSANIKIVYHKYCVMAVTHLTAQMSLAVIFILLCSVPMTGSSNYIVQSYEVEADLGVAFEKICTDRRTGRIYIGATNKLYEFSEDFEKVNEVDVGPKMDNVDCPDLNMVDCDLPKNLTDSHSKIILIDYENKNLIHCVSLYNGICVKHDLENVTRTEDPVYNHVVANDESSATFAFIAKGPSTDEKGHYVSVINIGNQVTIDNGRFHAILPSFASRNLHDFALVHKDILRASRLVLDQKFRTSFPIRYVYGFGSDGFSYMITVQKPSFSSISYISKIVRVCQKDKYFDSYAEIPLRCSYNGTLYNLAQSAYLGKAGSNLAKALLISSTEDVLYVSFSVEQPRSSLPTQESAVCIFPMREVRKVFTRNIKQCFNGIGVTGPAYFSSDSPCKAIDLDIDDTYCGEYAINSPIDGTIPVSVNAAFVFQSLVTTLIVDVSADYTVAFVGSDKGHILKVTLEAQTVGTIVDDAAIAEGQSIKPALLFDQSHEHIYAMTEYKIFKVVVEMCSRLASCGDCLGSRDPYCGWCVLEGRCSRKDVCLSGSEWINVSSFGQCPHVENITPAVMSDKEIQQLHIKASHYLRGVLISCTFQSGQIDGEFTHTVPATVSEDGTLVSCMPRNILFLKSRIKGQMNITVSIATNVSLSPIMEGHFTIYQCETFYRCKHCTSSSWKCKWCIRPNTDQPLCIDHDKSCNPGFEVIADECPRVTNLTMVSDDSSVRDSFGTVYLSRSSNYNINVTGINLLKPSSVSYKCKIVVSDTNTLWFNNTVFGEGGSFICSVHEEEMSTLPSYLDKLDATVEVVLGVAPVDGDTMPVVIYACENLVQPSYNCGRCKSFAVYQPHLHCQWCQPSCIDSRLSCPTTELHCGDPEITKVYPLSAHAHATTIVEIEGVNLGVVFNDTVNAVTVAGELCASIEGLYEPGVKIRCELSPSERETNGSVVLILANGSTGRYSKRFYHRIPVVTSIAPTSGPMSGGTLVSVHGQHLDVGRDVTVTVGDKVCNITNQHGTPTTATNSSDVLICKTDNVDTNGPHDVMVDIDGARVSEEQTSTYVYVADPVITRIYPKKCFYSGGRTLTIEGTNLDVIQTPLVYAIIDGIKTKSEDCTKGRATGTVYCPAPSYIQIYKHTPALTDLVMVKGENRSEYVSSRLGFKMDDVTSVNADNLPSHLATLEYFPDPVLENFTEVKVYQELRTYLVIKGDRLMLAADKNDVRVMIGCELCNVTFVSNEEILCRAPIRKPICGNIKEKLLDVNVQCLDLTYLSLNTAVHSKLGNIDRIRVMSFNGDLDPVSVRQEHGACRLDDLSILPKFEENLSTVMALVKQVWIGYFHQKVGLITYEPGLAIQSQPAVTNTLDESSNTTNMTVGIVVATFVVVIAIVGSILAYGKCRTMRRKDGTSVVFRNQTEEPNERRNHPAVSYSHARQSSGVYDVINDADVINEYLELLGEDPTYTKADEYCDPHPYRKIDETGDEPETKNERPVNDNPKGTDIHVVEKNFKLEEIEHQESVDKFKPDLDAEYLHPIASLKTENGELVNGNHTRADINVAEKNFKPEEIDYQESVDKFKPDLDAEYLHPIASLKTENGELVNGNHTRADINVAEKNFKPEEIEHQESVDNLRTDLDAEYVHPIASLKNEKGSLEELKSVMKDDDHIADCCSEVDGEY